MKRWMLVVFLLAVAMTLAPRTSLNPDGSALHLTGVLSRSQIQPGGVANFVVQARNTTTETVQTARLDITVAWDGEPTALHLMASPACGIAVDEKNHVVQCDLGSLRPGQAKTVHVTARALAPGTLEFSPAGTSLLGPIPAAQPQTVIVGHR